MFFRCSRSKPPMLVAAVPLDGAGQSSSMWRWSRSITFSGNGMLLTIRRELGLAIWKQSEECDTVNLSQGLLEIGDATGIKTMLNSRSLSGGIPDSSSGNTSGNSLTTGELTPKAFPTVYANPFLFTNSWEINECVTQVSKRIVPTEGGTSSLPMTTSVGSPSCSAAT